MFDPESAAFDHTTLSRRANKWRSPDKRQGHRLPGKEPVHVLVDSTGLEVYGVGQWLEEKHGAKSRRRWRKLHLALDADSGEIIAHVMTDQDAGDASQVEALLDQTDEPIGQFTADGAYDGNPTYDAVTSIAPALRWSFRHAPMRWNGQTPISPVNETVILLQSTPMGG